MANVAPKAGILDIAPYVPGAAGADIARMVHLASNENPLGCSEKACLAYKETSTILNRYPDGSAAALRDSLAAAHRIEAGQIVCGAGSDELIALLIKAYAGPGDEILYSRHGFLMYAISAKAAGAIPVSVPEQNLKADVESLLSGVTNKTKILFLANPNNPTGTYLTAAELDDLHARLPEGVILAIDSAYAEYVTAADYSDGLDLVRAHDNVVMLRTFSKIYGLAALRLGWGYFPPAIADVMNRVRGPFNVATPAQAAGVAALQDQEFVVRSRTHNEEQRAGLAASLTNLGLDVVPGAGNFLLVKFPDAKTMHEDLKKKGVLVRPVGAYGLPDYLRITVGTKEECEKLVMAVKGIL